MSPGFLFALFAVLLISVEAQRCRYSADKLPSKIVKYNKCLSIGYEPSIEGCVKQETDKKLRRNDKKKCAEMEKYLMKCGHTCDTDGGYSDFGEWSECDAECDGGTQARTRQCDNPAPVGNGAECQGDSSESRECNLNPCPDNAPRRISLKEERTDRAGPGMTGNKLKDLYRGGRLYCYKCVKTNTKTEHCYTNMCHGDCATIFYTNGSADDLSAKTPPQIRLCAPRMFSDDELCKIYNYYSSNEAHATCSVRRCSTYLCNNGEPTIKWRLDKKCGSGYPLPNSTGSECDPDGGYPCCSRASYGVCGNSSYHCTGTGSTDYRVVKHWREAGSPPMKWRFDRLCGSENPLPDGTPAECNPEGTYPCCSHSTNGKCGGKKQHCLGLEAVDYRLMKHWREEVGKVHSLGTFL